MCVSSPKYLQNFTCFPFQSLLSFILWTSAETQASITLTLFCSRRGSSQNGSLVGSFISPGALLCWRLSSHGWAGQGARTDTEHRPRAGSGVQGRKAACKMLFMPSELHLSVSLSTEHFTMCPGLFSTTLLSCDFVWSLGKGCQVIFFSDASRKELFSPYCCFHISEPELRASIEGTFELLSPGTFASHKPEAQPLCWVSDTSWWLHGGFMWGLFVFAFSPASLGRHIKLENSITLEAFNQLKILPEVNGHNSDKQSPACWILFIWS